MSQSDLPRQVKDLRGKKFGNLEVIGYAGVHISKQGKSLSFWECKCVCGTIIVVRGNNLSDHKSRTGTKSCGCTSHPKGNKNPRWSGHGEISGNTWYSIRNGAKYRDIPFDVTIRQVWNLFVKQDGKCALTGVELTLPTSGVKKDIKNATASLDRIDSSKGYQISNLQWVHKDINMMKKQYPQELFIEWCKKVAKHNKEG